MVGLTPPSDDPGELDLDETSCTAGTLGGLSLRLVGDGYVKPVTSFGGWVTDAAAARCRWRPPRNFCGSPAGLPERGGAGWPTARANPFEEQTQLSRQLEVSLGGGRCGIR